MDTPTWQWDERAAVGANFHDPEVAAKYDEYHARFRDIRADNERALEALAVGPGDVVLDMGTGTGWLAIQAARRGAEAYGVDIAPTMLAVARRNAAEAGAAVRFAEGGFLTYEHDGPPVTAAAAQLSLHHLPDFWKQVALLRLADMMADGGRLFLFDTVFSFPMEAYAAAVDAWVSSAAESQRASYARHVREEYSTMDWIMEGLLRRAGFTVVETACDDGFMARYLCRKETGR